MLSSSELFTLLRILMGALFAAHGAHKLFGWFGGHGLHAYGYDLAATGMRRARTWARLSSLFELAGGTMLALGLATPFAAALLVITRVVTVVRVHPAKGFWSARGGSEYSIVLIVLALLLVLTGPGSLALDHLIAYPWTYKTSLVLSILLATVGSVVAVSATSARSRNFPTSQQTT